MNIRIGNTPLIKINYKYKGKEEFVFAKLEAFNLSGSIKDRVAFYIVKEAYRRGELKKGMEIVEATSGNTGIALSAIGKFFGNPVHIFMPDWVSKERVKIMEMYGAKVSLISKEEGGFTKAVKESKEYAKKNNAFLSNQFENKDNILAHYETTGNEIISSLGEDVDAFVSGIGTGGTLIGVGKKIKEVNKNAKVYALEPHKMALISQNQIVGEHKIEGIGDEFIPKIIEENKEIIDDIILINDEDAINMSKKLAKELGLGVGISSGANLIASILLKGNKKKIVTVFADDNKKYLSTDLSKSLKNDEWMISNQVEFLGWEYIDKKL